MRQIRQALRLHLEAGLSYAQVGRAVGIGEGTVGKFVLLARAAGVDWAVAQTLTDEELEARLYRPAVPRASRQLEPDYAWIHQELKRPGVTLQLLWEEYQRGHANAGEPAYKYTSFCVKYRAWAASLKRSMRQTHIAGERLFVDYAGQTVPVIDAATGEIRARRSSWPCWARRTTPTPAPRRRRPRPTGSARSSTRWSSSAACRG